MYTAESRKEIQEAHLQLLPALATEARRCVLEGMNYGNERIRTHLAEGAARRLKLMRRALYRVFEDFPTSQSEPIQADLLADIQINLHAFLINISGFLDNLAWAFVLRHDLERDVGGFHGVGLFCSQTQRFLPAELGEFLKSELKDWHKNYAKPYRDALAHRVPPYVPPREMSQSDEETAKALDHNYRRLLLHSPFDLGALEALDAEEEMLGRPCFFFLHSTSTTEPSRPVMLHPQMIVDGRTVLACADVFFRFWGESKK